MGYQDCFVQSPDIYWLLFWNLVGVCFLGWLWLKTHQINSTTIERARRERLQQKKTRLRLRCW